MTARHEQRAAEHEQRVADRWTTTGNTGARDSSGGQPRKAEASVPAAPTVGHEPTFQRAKADAVAVGATSPDAASSAPLKPYWRRSPWWWLT